MSARTKLLTAALLAGPVLAGPALAPAPASAEDTCLGQVPTIRATAAAQRLVGTPGADVISVGGFAGVTVEPAAGDDLVCGGPGTLLTYQRDREGVAIDVTAGTVDGVGAGHDVFTGVAAFYGADRAADTFVGSVGDDSFDGGWKAHAPFPEDVADGGAGNDHLVATNGTLTGGDGDDALENERGSTYGGPGNDHVVQAMGGLVRGGDGDDLVETVIEPREYQTRGRYAFDVKGGAGDDIIQVTMPTEEAYLYPCSECEWKVDAGAGTDTLDLTRLGPPATSVRRREASRSAPTCRRVGSASPAPRRARPTSRTPRARPTATSSAAPRVPTTWTATAAPTRSTAGPLVTCCTARRAATPPSAARVATSATPRCAGPARPGA